MGTRNETLVGDSCIIGFRHFFSGTLTNVEKFYNITILDRNGLPVYTVLPADIIQTDLGTYEALIPSSVFTAVGNYMDVWNFLPSTGSSDRSLRFMINCVTVARALDPNLPAVLNCRLEHLTSCMLKTKYLWPVWSVLQNYELQDGLLQHHIDVGISWMERQLGIRLRHTRVLTRPYADDQTPPNPQLGVDYDEDGDLLQWSSVSSSQWSQVRLPHTNILRILGIRGVYQGRTVYRIPTEWVDGNQIANGFVRIRPTTTGTINSLVDNSGKFLDVTLLEALGNQIVPGFWAVDYEYGFANGYIAKEICDVIMKKASIVLLDQIGQGISRGISSRSASADGLGSSIGFVANAERSIFGALCASYEREITEENIMDMKRAYKGPMMVIL